jgi:hypothetical protein
MINLFFNWTWYGGGTADVLLKLHPVAKIKFGCELLGNLGAFAVVCGVLRIVLVDF